MYFTCSRTAQRVLHQTARLVLIHTKQSVTAFKMARRKEILPHWGWFLSPGHTDSQNLVPSVAWIHRLVQLYLEQERRKIWKVQQIWGRKKSLEQLNTREVHCIIPSHLIYRLPTCRRWPTGPCKVETHIRQHRRSIVLPEYTFTWSHTSNHFNPQILLPARPVLPKYFFMRSL